MKNEAPVLDDDFAAVISVKANVLSDADIFLKVQEVLADALEFERDEISMHDAFEHDLEMKPEDQARIIRGLEEEFMLSSVAINLIELKTVKALTTALKEVLAQK